MRIALWRLFANFERCVDVALDEFEFRVLVQLANGVAVGPVGTDKAGDDNDTGVGEQLGDLADPPNVLSTVFRGKAEVLV